MDHMGPKSKAKEGRRANLSCVLSVTYGEARTVRDGSALHSETGLPSVTDVVDFDRLNRLLRQLSREEEKVIRLYFGLGCQREHAAAEIADEFDVPESVIVDMVRIAQRQLARDGVTPSQLSAAAQQAREIGRPTRSQSMRSGHHRHHQP